MRCSKHIVLSVVFLLLSYCEFFAQVIPHGFNYQTTVRDASGVTVNNQLVSIRFTFYSNSPSGMLIWQEDHSGTTNNYGMIIRVIGTGASTGAGLVSSFSQIDWGSAFYYLKVSVDVSGGSAYTDMGTSQLFSVPYSFYSSKTGSTNSLSLSQLLDVNLVGNAPSKLLKWNGNYWMPAIDNDSDTVLYAFNSAHSISSDTAYYVFGALTVDTLLFAFHNDSSIFSSSASNVTNTNLSVHADTAQYAFFSSPSAWKTTGNTLGGSGNYFGTNDNSTINFISNNVLRAALKSNGSFSVNSSSSGSTLGLLGTDGLFVVGTSIDSSLNTISGAGTRMLYFPGRGAFRAGGVDSNQWDTINIGNYSMAVGFNSKARVGSFTSGSGCESVDYSVAMGRRSKALAVGVYPGGNSIAIGDSCLSTYQRTVAIGRNNISTGGTSAAIGYNNNASGANSICLGSNCISTGVRSTAIGYHATSANVGSFVFADASTTSPFTSSASHQFSVRASGGIIFYTDSLNTMGVMINSGSGSWSSVSDVNKKENFSEVNYESILTGIDQLKIKSWNYKSQARSIRHIGPIAQDFYKIFNVGENNITISSVDIDGVIISGIKGLKNRLDYLQNLKDIDSLKQRIDTINNSVEFNNRLDVIEAAIDKK